jgi:hypothetical protein
VTPRLPGRFPEPTELTSGSLPIDDVEVLANALADSMRCVEDLQAFRDRIALRCHLQPVVMAQVFMALAAWIDVDETTKQRSQRVEDLVLERRALSAIGALV